MESLVETLRNQSLNYVWKTMLSSVTSWLHSYSDVKTLKHSCLKCVEVEKKFKLASFMSCN